MRWLSCNACKLLNKPDLRDRNHIFACVTIHFTRCGRYKVRRPRKPTSLCRSPKQMGWGTNLDLFPRIAIHALESAFQ